MSLPILAPIAYTHLRMFEFWIPDVDEDAGAKRHDADEKRECGYGPIGTDG